MDQGNAHPLVSAGFRPSVFAPRGRGLSSNGTGGSEPARPGGPQSVPRLRAPTGDERRGSGCRRAGFPTRLTAIARSGMGAGRPRLRSASGGAERLRSGPPRTGSGTATQPPWCGCGSGRVPGNRFRQGVGERRFRMTCRLRRRRRVRPGSRSAVDRNPGNSGERAAVAGSRGCNSRIRGWVGSLLGDVQTPLFGPCAKI